jgi:hypothetical protein
LPASSVVTGSNIAWEIKVINIAISFSFVQPSVYVAVNKTTVYVFHAYTFRYWGSFNASSIITGVAASPNGGIIVTGTGAAPYRHLETANYPFYAYITGLSDGPSQLKVRISKYFKFLLFIMADCTISCAGGYCLDNVCYCYSGWNNPGACTTGIVVKSFLSDQQILTNVALIHVEPLPNVTISKGTIPAIASKELIKQMMTTLLPPLAEIVRTATMRILQECWKVASNVLLVQFPMD